MNALSIIAAASAPHDLWITIINWIQGAIGNYGWTILLFTILVKLVTSPLDFMVKYSTKKQTLIQKKCSPQVAKIQKKFGANQEQARIQTQAIYKREGLNVGTGCIIMLVNTILTMVVFFTLFASLREVSAYELINQYETIEHSYKTEFKNSAINYSDTDGLTSETYEVWIDSVDEAAQFINTPNVDTTTPEYAEKLATYNYGEEITVYANSKGLNASLSTWKQVNHNWLWVENIWVADATTPPLPAYDKLLATANNGGYGSYVEDNIDQTLYSTISAHIAKNADRTHNGYYILPILVGLLTFLSQWVSDLHNNLKNKKAQQLAKASDQTANTMKIMKIVMPLIMVGFAFSSSSSFAIYLLASSIATLAFGEIITLIINKLTKKQQKEVEEVLEKEAIRMIKKGKLQEK